MDGGATRAALQAHESTGTRQGQDFSFLVPKTYAGGPRGCLDVFRHVFGRPTGHPGAAPVQGTDGATPPLRLFPPSEVPR